MTSCDLARLWIQERALGGGLADPDSAVLSDHLQACPDCRAESLELERLSAALPPAPALRERVLLGTRSGRALPSFAGALARLFERDKSEMATLLAELESIAAWKPGFVAGNLTRSVRLGSSLPKNTLGLLLRTEPGVTIPNHRHGGHERTFVLAGGYRDSHGTEVWAGERQDMSGGSTHEILVLGDVPCVAAVLCHGGLIAV